MVIKSESIRGCQVSLGNAGLGCRAISSIVANQMRFFLSMSSI
jgi:hypothetical protein